MGQDEYLIYATIDAVAHWNINKPITPTDWNLHIKKKKSENAIQLVNTRLQ